MSHYCSNIIRNISCNCYDYGQYVKLQNRFFMYQEKKPWGRNTIKSIFIFPQSQKKLCLLDTRRTSFQFNIHSSIMSNAMKIPIKWCEAHNITMQKASRNLLSCYPHSRCAIKLRLSTNICGVFFARFCLNNKKNQKLMGEIFLIKID